MIRSLNTVNANMNILQAKIENTSANIANIQTPGYKFQDIIQTTMESKEMVNYTGGMNNNRRQELGGFTFSNEIDEIYKNFSEGPLVESGVATDFSIVGNGFFTIQLDNGEIAYTRNGNFSLNTERQLLTKDGYPVIGLDSDGQQSDIYVNDGELSSEFLITDFDDYQSLNSLGKTYYSPTGDGQIIDGEVIQGFLETSNVIMVDEMVKLIEISREFSANQKLVHTADETLNKAVNEIGRV